jgi:ATP-dependent DNA ligase
MKYTGSYIYPPRPAERITKEQLSQYDDGQFMAQPKYNGDAVIVIIHQGKINIYNRHKEKYTKCKIDLEVFWVWVPDKEASYVFSGEYLSKNKLGEDGKPFNNKLVIWDILVWESRWLINSTFYERASLIENVFPAMPRYEVGGNGELAGMEHCLKTSLPDIYRSPTYISHFPELYRDLVKTDLYEGLVLKRAAARLQPGWGSDNNASWQVKVRKPTNNYHF